MSALLKKGPSLEEEGRVLEKKADGVSIFNLSIGEWWKSGRELIAGYSKVAAGRSLRLEEA